MDPKNALRYAWQPYVVAIALIAAAAALRLWPLQALGVRLAWLTFYPAVVAAALYGGFSAGLLGTFLSCLTLLYLLPAFVDQPFIRDSVDWLGLAVFFITCTMISSVAEAMRRAQARAKQAKEQLKTANRGLEGEIVHRRAAEEGLRNSEHRLAEALKIVEFAIVSVDEAQRIRLFDQRAERIFRYSPQEVLGRPLDLLLPSRFVEAHRQHIKNFAASPDTARQMGARREVFGRRKDGTEFPAEAAISKVNQNGQITFTVVLRDITVRKRAEEMLKSYAAQLEAANKELEAFSYSVSHDLRAPLRSIDGFSQALLEDYSEKLDVEGKDHLQRVRAATQRMAQLIDDMLNLSRVTRSEMQREKVDLSTLAQTIAAELQKTQPERHVTFVIAPRLMVEGDARLLRVVLENLLANAYKFTRKQPQAKIEFGLTRQDGQPVYFVRDNGAGFDMAYADKLFGVFQRLHGIAEFEGTGIGLATVQRIIHRHGGRIWAEGAVEKGATIYFTL